MQKHLMIDIETLGTDPRSVMLSIGAVKFTEEKILDGFYCVLDADEQLRTYKRQVSADTISWWTERDVAARAVFNAKNKFSLETMLDQLIEWIGDDADHIKVWANGASFDLPLLATAFTDTGRRAPWRFWNERCYRTVKSMSAIGAPNRTGTHHNALDDAILQTQHLLAIWADEKAEA